MYRNTDYNYLLAFGSSSGLNQQQENSQSNTLAQSNQQLSSFGSTSSNFSFGNASQPSKTVVDGTLSKDQPQANAPSPSSNLFQFGTPASTSESGMSSFSCLSFVSSNSVSRCHLPNFAAGAGGFNFVPPGGFSPAGSASPNPMFSFGSSPAAGTAAPRRRITARGRKYR